jgi:4-hydroxy-2-oxoheptanedioate aldolase
MPPKVENAHVVHNSRDELMSSSRPLAPMPGRSFKDLIVSGEPLIGTWLTIPSPYAVEVIASVGFDWLCIDMQHGFVGDDVLPSILMAADITRTPTLVRPRWNDPSAIMRALDAGAAGVLVPLVNNAHEAGAAVHASRYPSDGIRSWGPMRPVVAGAPEPRANVVCVVMVETREAVRDVAEIASAPGVDGIFVGPSDLSLAVAGRLGADISEQTAAVCAECARHGLMAGIACNRPADAHAAVGAGFRLLTVSWDVGLLGSAARDLRQSVRDLLNSEPS